jgi:hypothetical protein
VSAREDVWLAHGTTLQLGDLHVAVQEVHVHSRAGIPTLLTLELVLDFDAWRRVEGEQLLHLIPGARGDGPEPHEGDVRVEVRMDDDLLADVFTGEELTAEDTWQALRDGDWPAALRPGAWFATRVRQDLLPGLAAGFVTAWASAEEVTGHSTP